MYSNIISGAILGVNALPVNVEVDISSGLPTFVMVGCPGSEVKESKERVWTALKNTGIKIPVARITVNLSPADIHKEGTSYDLPIAIGILSSARIIPADSTGGILMLGELGLNGEIKPVKGVLPIIRYAAGIGIRECIVPKENAAEGSVIPGIKVHGADNIIKVMEFLNAGIDRDKIIPPTVTDIAGIFNNFKEQSVDPFADIVGQEAAKRAALIAAAGFHNLLMTGPPGAGKSMIAGRIAGILPPLTPEESLEVTTVYSVAGMLPPGQALITERSFQSPHHTISLPAMIGGGSSPRPGVISLAHRSVLFLDELTEFDIRTLDSLRQPIENKKITINRSRYSVEYPSDFLLICAMNPCPCGYFPDRNRCKCSEPVIKRYLGKISGPILDRIDLCVELSPVELKDLHMRNNNSQNHNENKTDKDNASEIDERLRIPANSKTTQDNPLKSVISARKIQHERYEGTNYKFNSQISSSDLEKYCHLGEKEFIFMESVYKKLGLSMRSYHKILRVARTIADLEGSSEIKKEHLLEASGYRPDLNYWNK